MGASCAAANYCMSCNTSSQCTACFNWGSGKVGARSLASNVCTTALTRTVSNAQLYSGTHTNSSVWSWASAVCKDSKTLQIDQTVASPYTPTCTSTVATGATAIANCDWQSVVKTSTSAATAYCVKCKKNIAGNSTNTACSGTLAITNCEYASGVGCHFCKSKYAVASTGTTCTSFTTDSNCRVLLSDGTCGTCWHAYYFNLTKCKLFAKVVVAGLAMAITSLLF